MPPRAPARRPIVLLALLALAACKPGPADLGMSDSTYVQVLAELRQVGDPAGVPPALRATRRDAVFRKHKVTAEAIEAASAALADDPTRAGELWRKVDEKAASLPPLR